MYSNEIEDILNRKNHVIDSETYLHICNTSPQINHVQYFSFSDYFHIDTNDDYHFDFKVYRKN